MFFKRQKKINFFSKNFETFFNKFPSNSCQQFSSNQISSAQYQHRCTSRPEKMPPGPNLGDNRFAALAQNESPHRQNKRKKKENVTTLQFPFLPEVPKENPKFVIMESSDEKRSLSQYSCFAVYKSIQAISKDVIEINELRDGNLLLLVKNKIVAEKFLTTKELIGLGPVKVKFHVNLNSTKGTIYAPYLINVSEKEIVEELSHQGVTSAYKFQKRDGDKYVPSGVILLTFNLYHLPSKLDISWRTVNIREYIPTPMRCKSCQKLGHTQKHCKNTPMCCNCNLPPHNDEKCSRTQCANCIAQHPASSKECTKFAQAKEILTIKTKNKCTMREAMKKYRDSMPASSHPNTSTYSSIAKQQVFQKNNHLPSNQPPSTSNTTINNQNSKKITHNTNTISNKSTPITTQSNLVSSHKQIDKTINLSDSDEIIEETFKSNTIDTKTPLLPSLPNSKYNFSDSDLDDINSYIPMNFDEDL